jgi:site-specific DNA-methyltransferase (adenine-specific)
MPSFSLYNADCLAHLRTLENCSIHSIVTDPPYGISFMGKKWDYDVPSVDIWKECLRVLKPGGHLLAFAGTRTQHRMAANIEDAGFDIRDLVMWHYGSGFPKSHNLSKAIDKAAGAEGGRGPMKRGGERLARLENGKRDGEGRWGDESGRDPYTYLPATPRLNNGKAGALH